MLRDLVRSDWFLRAACLVALTSMAVSVHGEAPARGSDAREFEARRDLVRRPVAEGQDYSSDAAGTLVRTRDPRLRPLPAVAWAPGGPDAGGGSGHYG